MEANRPSQTAQEMAVHRAAHQLFDRPPVLDDPFALRIVGPEAEAALRSGADDAWHAEGPQRGLRAHLVGRSRFSEDSLTESVARGVPQYVLLGAGLDSSAYRAAQKYPHLRIFEVDHPATQAWKRERLQQAGIVQPESLSFAPVDFETETLPDGLARAGFDMKKAAMFVWLGVVPYLTREAIIGTLGFIASLPRNTEVVFDYAEARTEESQRAALEELKARLAAMGEPLNSLHEPEALRRDVLALGYSMCETFDIAMLNKRYFDGRMADFMKPIRGHLMRARV